MKKIILGALWGGLTVFLWLSVSWMIIPGQENLLASSSTPLNILGILSVRIIGCLVFTIALIKFNERNYWTNVGIVGVSMTLGTLLIQAIAQSGLSMNVFLVAINKGIAWTLAGMVMTAVLKLKESEGVSVAQTQKA